MKHWPLVALPAARLSPASRPPAMSRRPSMVPCNKGTFTCLAIWTAAGVHHSTDTVGACSVHCVWTVTSATGRPAATACAVIALQEHAELHTALAWQIASIKGEVSSVPAARPRGGPTGAAGRPGWRRPAACRPVGRPPPARRAHVAAPRCRLRAAKHKEVKANSFPSAPEGPGSEGLSH